MRLVLGLIAVLTALSASLVAVATAGQGQGRPALPPGAVEVGEGTYYLGKKKVDGVELQGYAFVHRRGDARSAGKPGGGSGSTCYSLLASGAKWKTTEPFEVNTTTAPAGVATMLESITTDVDTWEAAAGNTSILGDGTSNGGYTANLNAVDGVNGAEFASIADPGVIAVTYTWGYYGGPAKFRELVEWDMLFDDDGDFTWATDGLTNAMDFENIVTHELGHAMGLGHPSGTCTEETMYAYASNGETKKRTLNAGDIAGINVMY